MATYRGGEIPVPDRVDEDVKMGGPPLPGMENVEEGLNLPPEAGPDYVPRPGEKHYMDTKPMAQHIEPPFDPQGSGYDYKQARDAGLSPQPVPHDTVPHWPSREPGSGLLLKGRAHPTFDIGVEHDRLEGYGLEIQNGRYYSQPFEQPACKYGSSTNIKCKNKDQ